MRRTLPAAGNSHVEDSNVRILICFEHRCHLEDGGVVEEHVDRTELLRGTAGCSPLFDHPFVSTMRRAAAFGVGPNRITLLRDADGWAPKGFVSGR